MSARQRAGGSCTRARRMRRRGAVGGWLVRHVCCMWAGAQPLPCAHPERVSTTPTPTANPTLRAAGAYEHARKLYVQLKLIIESDIAAAAVGSNQQSFEAGIIARARAEKQREAAVRAMTTVCACVRRGPPLRGRGLWGGRGAGGSPDRCGPASQRAAQVP